MADIVLEDGRSVWTISTRQGSRVVRLEPCPCGAAREPVQTLGTSWLRACMEGCDSLGG